MNRPIKFSHAITTLFHHFSLSNSSKFFIKLQLEIFVSTSKNARYQPLLHGFHKYHACMHFLATIDSLLLLQHCFNTKITWIVRNKSFLSAFTSDIKNYMIFTILKSCICLICRCYLLSSGRMILAGNTTVPPALDLFISAVFWVGLRINFLLDNISSSTKECILFVFLFYISLPYLSQIRQLLFIY